MIEVLFNHSFIPSIIENMIIYNVTVKIEDSVHDEWLHWMKSVHIKDVLKTGVFEKHVLSRIISMKDPEGTTYSIQYFCKDMKTLHQYQVQHAPKLQQEHTQRYQGKFVAFRTMMEVVD